jgi:hypothetical protein
VEKEGYRKGSGGRGYQNVTMEKGDTKGAMEEKKEKR